MQMKSVTFGKLLPNSLGKSIMIELMQKPLTKASFVAWKESS